MRRLVALALFAFLAVSQPVSYQSADDLSNEPIITTDQAQWPPPPECGLYDTCQDKRK